MLCELYLNFKKINLGEKKNISNITQLGVTKSSLRLSPIGPRPAPSTSHSFLGLPLHTSFAVSHPLFARQDLDARNLLSHLTRAAGFQGMGPALGLDCCPGTRV